MNSLIGNFTGFGGRLNRQPFWLSALVLTVISLLISLLLLPVIGLSVMPDMSALMDGTTRTPEEIAALVGAAQSRGNWISLVLFVVFLYPSAAICIKRRHDRNGSGIDVWIYMALIFVTLLVQALGIGTTIVDVGGMQLPVPGPVVSTLLIVVGLLGLYLFIVMGFLKGTTGANTYGPDPLQG